jgi:hypothetical protein
MLEIKPPQITIILTVLLGTTILHSSDRFFSNDQNHITFVNAFKCTFRCITKVTSLRYSYCVA